MANQQNSYTGSQGTGTNNADFAFTFPSFTASEVKVEVDNVVKTLTTHYTVENHNTTSGGTVRFTAGNIPTGTTPVRIFRQTNVDTAKAEFTAGSSLKANEVNDNFKQLRHALQEAIGANTTDRKVQRFNIEADAIDGTLIADDVINSEHYVAGSIDLEHMSANSVDSDQYVDGSIDGVHIANDQIDSQHYAAGSIDLEHMSANSVDSDQYVDGSIDLIHMSANSVDSDQYVDGSIDLVHMSANSVDSDQYVDGSIDHVHLANDAVDGDNIANDSINSEHYVDLSIDTQHIANEQVTTAKLAPDAVTSAKIADDQINSEHYVAGSIDHEHLANDIIDGDNIQDDVINSEHYVAGSIDHEHLAADIVDGDNIADNSINSEHYVDGSINEAHLASSSVSNAKVADNAINTRTLATNSVTNNEIAGSTITSDKLNPATVITSSEQASATTNDTSFLTSAAADARFFNISTGDTIKDGDTFPDNDTTIATTAAINDRIIDLVDDVGGFVPIANETSFPTSNPDINNPATGGTIVSVSAASTNLAPSGTTVTIANGRGSGLAVVITGVTATIPSGFGFLVETTSTDHTYAFHRLVPKATEVTTVAGKATEIGRLGTAAAVEDMSILGTADVVADLNTLGTADVVADMNMLATSDVISDMNTLAVTDVINDMDTVAGISSNVTTVAGISSNVTTVAGISSNVTTVANNNANVTTVAGANSNISTVAGSIANVNTTASNIADVNNFAGTYQIASSAPSTDGGGNSLGAGDLYFDTSSNELRVYNGSAWQGGVTATGNLAGTGANTFTGNQTIQSTHPKLLLTDTNANSDFSVHVNDGVWHVRDETNNTNRIEIQSDGTVDIIGNLDAQSGVDVTGNITVTGNVDGRDVAADGTKLDGIESAATADQTAAEIKTLFDSNGIVNSNVDASAAIAGTKISPDFGSQTITTTGTVNTGLINASSTSDQILNLNSSDNGAVYLAFKRAGGRKAYFGYGGTGSTISLVNEISDGDITIAGSDGGSQINMLSFNTSENGRATFSGNIELGGTVDGRDVAADGTKLDGIESNATADQTSTEIKSLLASDNLTAAHLAANSVGTSELAVGAVTHDQLADDTVDADHLQSNAVTTAKIANDAVTADKLADTSVSAGSYGSSTAIPAITVDAQGRITAASTNTVNTTTNLGATAGTDSIVITSSTGTNVSIGEATSSTAGFMSTTHHDKLDGIAASANNYSHPNHSGDVTSSGDGATTIASSAVTTAKIADDAVTGAKIASNAIDSEHYATGSIDTAFIGDLQVTTAKIANDAITNAKIADDAIEAAQLDNNCITSVAIANDAVTQAKIVAEAINEGRLQVSNAPQDGYMLTAQSGNTGGLTWAPAAAGATGASNDEIFWENGTNVTADYTITNGRNAGSFGPITIDSGVTVTVGSGETWTVV